LEDHKEEILLLAHGYRNLAEMKSWMAKKKGIRLSPAPRLTCAIACVQVIRASFRRIAHQIN